MAAVDAGAYYVPQQTAATILCCMCGTAIPANPSSMCVNCLRSQVDITDGIPKSVVVHYCKACGRYLQPPNQWLVADLESRELLAFCIKRLRGLSKVRLIEAGFVWTEPHSKRIKVKLTIQKEVFTNTILQQVFIVEYALAYQQCDQCTRLQTNNDHWVCSVQLRQHVEHKRTFLFLEQLIIKHNAHVNASNVRECHEGIDFYFRTKQHGQAFMQFLQQTVPTRNTPSEQLISVDVKNNTAMVKYSFSVEIAPICREDLVCLPTRVASSLGNIPPLVLCIKVSNILHFMDVNTLQTCDVRGEVYWNNPFRSLFTSRNLVEFIVLDVERLNRSNGKYTLADVTVARTADFGVNDTQYQTRTHLGNVLNYGDTVVGYFLPTAVYNDDDIAPLTKAKHQQMPDVVLVRKSYPKLREHIFEIKTIAKDDETETPYVLQNKMADFERFMDTIDHDPELRSKINLYKPADLEQRLARRQVELAQLDAVNPDAVQLSELIEDLTLNAGAEPDGEDAVAAEYAAEALLLSAAAAASAASEGPTVVDPAAQAALEQEHFLQHQQHLLLQQQHAAAVAQGMDPAVVSQMQQQALADPAYVAQLQAAAHAALAAAHEQAAQAAGHQV